MKSLFVKWVKVLLLITLILSITAFNFKDSFDSKTYGAGVHAYATEQKITVKVNGTPVYFDVEPIVMEGRTMVPLRAIFEVLGAQVEWDGDTNTITGYKGTDLITLQIDNKTAYVNGNEVTLDVAPIIIDARTLVPVRFIAEAFGADVQWDEATSTVLITVVKSLSATTDRMVVEPGTDGKITKDPLELTLFMCTYKGDRFDYKKQTIFHEAFKMTNIKCRGTIESEPADFYKEFNIMLASRPFPDIIHGSKTKINQVGMDGGVIPLDDLINQYAPNIKAYLDAYPDVRKGSVASDGELYYIPYVQEDAPTEGFFIRTDWLKKLNLEIPKTVAEYYNVLKAFREKDPNGNRKKDEIPYFYRDKGIDSLLQLFGSRSSWYVDTTGKVVHGKVQPEYKNAMINLAKWYGEGIIDKDIYWRGQQSREYLLGDNTGGSTHDWFGSTGATNKTLSGKISGFEFAAIAPPADVNGVVKEEFSCETLPGYGWGISMNNNYIVETIKYFDFWYSEQGKLLYNFGVKGVDYTLVDGKPMYTDRVLKADEGPISYLSKIGQNEIGSQGWVSGTMQTMNSYGREGFKMYYDNNYCLKPLPHIEFTQEELRIKSNLEQPLLTYMAEVQQKWIFCNEQVSDGFDAYVEQLKAMGYDELQAIYQVAYDRYLKQ